jgi:hypothetical protein
MNDEIWKKIHVTIRNEDYQQLKTILPERGAFQHLVRRFIKALIANPVGETVTVPLRMSLWEAHSAND